MPMVTDAFMDTLPADPVAALNKLDDHLRRFPVGETGIAIEREYVLTIRTFVEVHQIEIALPRIDDDDWVQTYEAHKAALDLFKTKQRFLRHKQASTGEVPVVVLDVAEKARIHELLQQVREIVEGSNLPANKKNAIFTKIAGLAKEIDRTGTAMEGFFGLWVEASIAMGQGAERAKPFFDRVCDILDVILHGKERQEGLKLPSRKQLRLEKLD